VKGKIQNMKSPAPVHLYIPENSLEQGKHLSDVKRICDEGIDGLWLETGDLHDPGPAGELASSTRTKVVQVLKMSTRLPGFLDSGTDGLAVKPSIVKDLLRYRNILVRGGTRVYLCVDNNDVASAGGFSGLLKKIEHSYNILKDSGICNIYINAFHSDTVVHFNINRYLKKRLGAPHVISTGPVSTGHWKSGKKSNVALPVVLGALFYEEAGDIVLLTLPPGLSAAYPNLREQLDITRKTLGPLGFFPTGITVISCPTCGRCNMDLIGMAGEITSALKDLEITYSREGRKVEDTGGITVAVMGCNVNGPGEARNADLGIAGRKDGSAVIFKNGSPVKSLPGGRVVDELVLHTKNLIDERLAGRSNTSIKSSL
jgi:(E)-4-hydroxy-3-methylbut-2-enyl-diphosphate synthase